MVLLTSFPIQTEAATIKLNKTTASVYVGSSTTLKMIGTSEEVTWSTSNKKVATISSKGKVTGKKAGTATITLKGKDGTSYKCQITLKKSSNKTSSNQTMTYVCNTNTMKFHYKSCYSVKRIKAENYDEYTGDRDDLIENGYDPCKNCNP